MKIKVFSGSPEEWNSRVIQSATYGFWSDYNWLLFNKSIGKNIELYSVQSDSEEPIGYFAIEIVKRKFTRYGYILGGVYIVSNFAEYFDISDFSSFCNKFAKANGLFTIRFDVFENSIFELLIKNSGKIKTSFAMGLPRYFGEINLNQNVEDLKKNISSSSKNNINKATKLGLEVKEVTSQDGVKTFYSLMSETTSRKGFLNHSFDYFKSQFEYFLSLGNSARLFICYKDDIAISAAWVNIFGTVAYYTHGASTSDQNLAKLRSQYFLQWSLIELFKKEGFDIYNMWGVLPSKYIVNKSIKGVSDFKYNMGCSVGKVSRLYEFRYGITGFFNKLYDFYVYRSDRF